MKVYARYRLPASALSGIAALLLASAGAVSPASHPHRVPEATEKPDMLERVDRRPGILAAPTDLPDGDQAGIYLDLLETDPENTRFQEEWEQRVDLEN